MAQGAWLCAAGLAFGLGAGLASGRLLGAVLYGVAPNDFQTVVAVVAFLMIISMAACYVPAREATRAELTTLLRDS
jgi:ABC-type antimicrobial peptide transport system permease subunit